MVLDEIVQQHALAGVVAGTAPGERLREHRVVGERRPREVPVQRFPERGDLRILRHGLQLREKVQGARAEVGIRAAQHHRRERRARLAVVPLLAQRATAGEARAAGEWIGGIARRVRDVLRGGLVLRRQPARSEQRERLLEQRRRRTVAGAAAVAERGELDARELVERLAVAVRVEQRLGPTDELHRRDRLAGTELPLPRAG